MWRKLSDFYVSKEWREFRQLLINERTSKEDGVLYDEHNGEPLINSWDIVLHHKQELTVQNVNDYSISLNPDNIMIVSHRSHNEIHARFGYAQGKKVYYVYGPPCGGKSTWVKGNKGNSDIVADIDLIWQALTGGERYRKPEALKGNAFGLYAQMLDMVRTRQGRWQRAYIITGGAHKGQRERQLQDLGAEPVFIDTDIATCKQRLRADKERETVRDKWEGYIDEWFKVYQE